jgi:MerR family copper efflux transcriptional regulator
MTIGSLAREAQVGVETIRFYEREGLLAQPRRPGRGYRVYPPEALERVRFIRRSKAMGFTLDEIRELLALRARPGVPCGVVREQALAKVADIDRKLAELHRLREAIATLAHTCSGDTTMQHCSILTMLEGEPATSPPPHRQPDDRTIRGPASRRRA